MSSASSFRPHSALASCLSLLGLASLALFTLAGCDGAGPDFVNRVNVGDVSPMVPGGQSGGTSGAAPGPECYCNFDYLAKARVVSTGDDGACAVFELLEMPEAETFDYHGVEVGDTFGGQAYSLCASTKGNGDAALNAVAGDIVYVEYLPGAQAGSECAEYKECSAVECGTLNQEDSDQAAVWDRCDEACLEETRADCAAHADLARYTGRVTVASVGDNGNVGFTKDGHAYSVPKEELSDGDCRPSSVPRSSTVVNDMLVCDEGTQECHQTLAAAEPADAPAPAPAPALPTACPIPE